MLHLLLAFATIAFALNSLEVQNEQLKKTNEALRNALRAMKTNKEATVVAEVMVGAGYCPSGWELTFPGHPDGECQQEPINDGETRVYDAQTVDACKEACASDSSCVAFDFLPERKYCFKNTRCDKQDQGDGYLSCKRVQTGEEESNQCYSYNDPENATFENCAEGKVCVNYNRSWWNSGKLLFRELYGGCKEADFCPGFRYMADLYGSTTGESVKYCTECSSDKCNTPRN